jgi:hypothetical protein
MDDLQRWLGVPTSHIKLHRMGEWKISDTLTVEAHRDAAFEKAPMFHEWLPILRYMCATRKRRGRWTVYFTPSLLPRPKKFPERSTMGLTDINSGMCHTASPTLKRIYVFRDQEMRKVFIHEVLHALHDGPGIDVPVDHLVTRLAIHHPWISRLQPRIAFAEAIVEAAACAIETMLRTAETGSDATDAEMEHSRRLCLTFFRWGDAHSAPRCTSHALEYILLKHVLFREWMREGIDINDLVRRASSGTFASFVPVVSQSVEFGWLCSRH